VRQLALVVALCGCDRVLGLDTVRIPADATADVNCAALVDFDHDCVADDVDNCPADPNTDQADSGDGDGVGDVCDPHPRRAGDSIQFFTSFRDPAAERLAWMPVKLSQWTFLPGAAAHSDDTDAVGLIQRTTADKGAGFTLEAGFTFHSFATIDDESRLAVWIDQTLGAEDGQGCWPTPFNNNGSTTDLDSLNLQEEQELGGVTRRTDLTALVAGDTVVVRLTRDLRHLTCIATVDGSLAALDTLTTTVPWRTGGHIALEVPRAIADVTYVVAYATSNPP